jgi:hypothetical protein
VEKNLMIVENKTMKEAGVIRFVTAWQLNIFNPTAARNHAKWIGVVLMAVIVLFPRLVSGAGLIWPSNQLLPIFSTPAPVIDCIDVSSASGPEIDLFTSLEGIVNRTQPRVACVSTVNGEGEFTWVKLHNLRPLKNSFEQGVMKEV